MDILKDLVIFAGNFIRRSICKLTKRLHVQYSVLSGVLEMGNSLGTNFV